MDLERGVVLRNELYVPREDTGEYHCVEVLETTKFHQLPNGGWIPVEGDITLHLGKKGLTYDFHQNFVVDVNSISIDKKDIPDSLFDIQFPPGARIQNHLGRN
jgi:hypothetical protein